MKKTVATQENQSLTFPAIVLLIVVHLTTNANAWLQPRNTLNMIIRNTLYKEDDPTKYPHIKGEQYIFLTDLTIAIERNRRSEQPKTALEILQQQVDALSEPASLDVSQEKIYKTRRMAETIAGQDRASTYLQGLTFSLFHSLPSLFILEAMNKRVINPKDKIDTLLPSILAICNQAKSKNAQANCYSGLERIIIGTTIILSGSCLAYTSNSDDVGPDEITAGAFFGIPIIFSGSYYIWSGTQNVIKGLKILFW